MPLEKLRILFLSAAAVCHAAPVHLRCDYRENPIGIDSAAPALSWQNDSAERGWRQSAYQVLVASRPGLLATGKADVWDSGKREGDESVGVVYAGKKLEPSRRYYWTVRVWDSKGVMSKAEAPAWWETGLMNASGWSAKWISRRDAEEEADREGIRWVWVQGQNPFAVPRGTEAVFHIDVAVGERPRSAALYLVARAPFVAAVNGRRAGSKDGRWQAFDREDITELLVEGRNSIDVSVKTNLAPPSDGAAEPRVTAVAGLLKITEADGTIRRYPTDARWQARLAGDSEWKPAAVAGSLGDPKMGRPTGTLPSAASLFRREFDVAKPVKSARLYITALGSYTASVNGKPVSEDVLTPAYTDYAKRVTYRTYDVTPLIARGRNAIGAMLGDGWFGSALTWTGIRFSFLPPPPRLLAQLEIRYADGSSERIATDGGWKTAAAPVLSSEIYAGETYDARLERTGWNRAGYTDAGWDAATVSEAPPGVVSAAVTDAARVVDTLKPKSIKALGGGAYIVDMGQNMVGWLKLAAAGPAGTKIRMRFAEILNPDGTIYTENLRNANQTDSWYLKGGGRETFRPHFTFHGFRYVEITGYPGKLSPADIEGEVVTSARRLTGRLKTSSELVNRMWKTGIWGQRGNFVTIPTDCPQRDERLGWMGDAQVFWRTGSYNADIASFGRKWLRDVVDDQTPDGSFTNTSPDMPADGSMPPGFVNYGAPGWADAGVIVPWTAWQQYGDTGIIREVWNAMEKYMALVENANPDYLRRNKTGANFSDWLPAGSVTPKDLVATAYWALSAQMMAGMANAIHKPDAAKKYEQVYERIRAAFQKAFAKPDGTVGSGSQTSYVLALHMRLLPESLRQAAFEKLVKDIEAHDWHLTTGFLGTPHLLFVLADNGRPDVAYRLLLNETYPSWGYMIRSGATTWWERWNSDKGDPSMNSFNHYAFGSVMAWVYRYVAGIDTAFDAPGFKKLVIHPRVDGSLTHARGEYDSVYGKIVTDWTGMPKGPFSMKVTIPANTTAKVYLPASAGARVTESGKPVAKQTEAGSYVVEIGSGSYAFEVK